MNTTHQILHIAAAAILAATGAHGTTIDSPAPRAKTTRAAPLRIHVIDEPLHRAIFCGWDGTETSAIYAQMLARDLDRLEATGRTTAESLAHLKAKACDGQGAEP